MQESLQGCVSRARPMISCPCDRLLRTLHTGSTGQTSRSQTNVTLQSHCRQQECLSLIYSKAYSVLIHTQVDIGFPGDDGLEIARHIMESRTDGGEATTSSFPTLDFNHATPSEPLGHGIDADRLQQAASILRIRPEDLSGALAAHRPPNTLPPPAQSVFPYDSFHHYDGPSGSEQEHRFGRRTEIGGALSLEPDLSTLFPEAELGQAPEMMAAYDRMDSEIDTHFDLHRNEPMPQFSNSNGRTTPPGYLLAPLPITSNESDIHEEPNGSLLPLPEIRSNADTSNQRGFGNGLTPRSLVTSGSLDTGQEALKQTPLIASSASRGDVTWHSRAAAATESNLPPDVLHTIMSGPCSRVWKIPPKPVSITTYRKLWY